jgi:hypothetical protein
MGSGRSTRRRILVACLAMCALLPSAFATAQIEEGRRRVWEPTTGVTLTRIRYETPNQVRVLRVNTSLGAGLDIRVPGSAFPARAQTSAMGAAQKVAIASVNGDYERDPGVPVHPLLVDGELWTSGIQKQAAVGWSADGTRAYAGPPALQIQLLGPDGVPLFDILKWNDTLVPWKVNGYSRRGGYPSSPPGVPEPGPNDPLWCAARLVVHRADAAREVPRGTARVRCRPRSDRARSASGEPRG